MNPIVGWVLAALALLAGWRGYGWPGLALGATLIVFWLLLQFSRSVRVMRMAGASPVGRVPSAVMLSAKLRNGMQMLSVLALTKSLGRRVENADGPWSAAPTPAATGDSSAGPASGRSRPRGAPDTEAFTWADDGGAEVVVTFRNGRSVAWALHRPPEAAE
jgi:hypothetical protein